MRRRREAEMRSPWGSERCGTGGRSKENTGAPVQGQVLHCTPDAVPSCLLQGMSPAIPPSLYSLYRLSSTGSFHMKYRHTSNANRHHRHYTALLWSLHPIPFFLAIAKFLERAASVLSACVAPVSLSATPSLKAFSFITLWHCSPLSS